MNLNLRCPEIFYMTKMTSIIDNNYQILAHKMQQTNRLPNYDCRKTKFDSGSSLLWEISRRDM